MSSKSILKKITVLYVEDDENTREEIAFFLEKFVKTLFIAENGEKGLELYKKNHPDLVITDIQMPVMNGIDMARKIKSINKNVPIMVTTAFNETDSLINAINNGVNRYILKPINLKNLIKEIEELFNEYEYQSLNLSLDVNGVILDVSQAWLNFLGYKKDEVIGKLFLDFVNSASQDVVKNNCQDMKDYGFLENIQFNIKHKDGSNFQVILYASKNYNENGSFAGTNCEIKNIEYFKHSENEITKILEKERYISRLITTYASISNIISRASSLELYFQDVTDALSKNIEYEYVFISLYRDSKQFEIVSQSKHSKLNMIEILGEKFSISSDKYCPTCESYLNNKIIIIDDISQLKNYRIKKDLETIDINAITAIPLRINENEKCLGVLTIMFNKTHKSSKVELELFKTISETISFGMQAIENRIEKEKLIKELDIQATTDALTKCVNRHKGSQIVINEVERSHRYNRPLSLLYFDVDFFKTINDIYGHEQGDQALISIAKITNKLIRKLDISVRWGGEEFIIILPECDLNSAVIIAEKLRTNFEAHEFIKGRNLTASFGVATLQDSENWEHLIKRADDFMYKAKRNGRNRVVYA